MVARGASGLSGILAIDKPAGMTSHDVVARVRRAVGEKRVGHAGTLDPAATGLLVVLVGPATRLEPYLSAARKSYTARIVFGTATDTDDAEGAVVRTASAPADVFDPAHAREMLARLLGPSEQMPPAYSAIKVGGVTAHRAARAGNALKLQSRPIEVYRAELVDLNPESAAWIVNFEVSKGTYIRALARDLGEAAGAAAHLSGLRRTASGEMTLEAATSLEAVESAGPDGIEQLFVDPIAALGALPVIEAPLADVANGRSLPLPVGAVAGTGDVFAVVCEHRLKALYRAAGDALVPAVVLATGIRRCA